MALSTSLYPGAGCDEAGRGCLAGPVVAAAVLLPHGLLLPGLNDSKKLSAGQRSSLAVLIRQQAVAWGIGLASAHEVERYNVMQASFLAMHRAVDALRGRGCTPCHLWIDGPYFRPYRGIAATCVVGGDGKIPAVAAASVLAKHYRDMAMCQWAALYPWYGWERNAGYPTRGHREAIARWGLSPLHRRTFRSSLPGEGQGAAGAEKGSVRG